VTVSATDLSRWTVLAALTLATVVMFAVSVRGNYLFGYGLGQTPEKRELFAWANVAADVWKAFGLVAVTALWRGKHRRAASTATIAWFICLLFGINSALGVYVQDRATLTGSREATHTTYREAEAELVVVEGQLRALATHRSIGEVEAAINALLARAVVSNERVRGTVGSISLNCNKVDARTQQVCAEIGNLRQELAVANEAHRLQTRSVQLRESILFLRERGGSAAPDPVAEFYAWLTAGFVSVRDVSFGFPLAFALLIEIVSAFGPITIAAYAEASKRDVARYVVPGHGTAGREMPRQALATALRGETAAVLSWMAERAVPTTDTRAIGIDALYADYVRWSSSTAMSAPLFQTEFDRVRDLPDLVGKIRKFGDRYYGIAFAGDVDA
jgi:hypothetical protein